MAPSTSVGDDTPSVGSSPLLSYESLTRGGDPPSVGVVPSPSIDARVSVGVWGAPPTFRSLPAFTSWVLPPVCTPRVPLTVESPHPNPDGFAGPTSFLGGHHFEGHGVSPSLHGGVPHPHGGGLHSQRQGISFPSLGLTDDHWRTFNFPGGCPLVVPHFVYGPSRPHLSHGGSDFPSSGSTADYWRRFNFPGGLPPNVPSIIHSPEMPDPSHGGSPLASASVVSRLPLAAPPLRPLTHEDLSGSSALDLTMSFWAPTSAVIAPLVVPLVVPPVGPPVVPLPPVLGPAPRLPTLLSRHRRLFLLPRLRSLCFVQPSHSSSWPLQMPRLASISPALSSTICVVLSSPLSAQIMLSSLTPGMPKPVLIGRAKSG
jgi:hypothetical protein